MAKPLTTALLALLAGVAVHAQPLTFEVATIKPSPPRKPGEPQGRFGCFRAPGSKTRFACARASISTMAIFAYNLQPYELRPPFSTDTAEFNIDAKLPAGTTDDQLPVMLANLLSERFKLAFHREPAEVKGYVLVTGKNGAKIKEAASQATPPAEGKPTGPVKDADGFFYTPGMRGTLRAAIANGLTRWVGNNVAVDSDVRNDPRLIRLLSTLTGLPVVDATGLKGKYDFTLTFSSDSMAANDSATLPPSDLGPTLFKAVEEQLGLKLESRKVPVNLFVIDHVEKSPSEN